MTSCKVLVATIKHITSGRPVTSDVDDHVTPPNVLEILCRLWRLCYAFTRLQLYCLVILFTVYLLSTSHRKIIIVRPAVIFLDCRKNVSCQKFHKTHRQGNLLSYPTGRDICLLFRIIRKSKIEWTYPMWRLTKSVSDCSLAETTDNSVVCLSVCRSRVVQRFTIKQLNPAWSTQRRVWLCHTTVPNVGLTHVRTTMWN